MKTIYKYNFDLNKSFDLMLPLNFDILKVDIQDNTPTMWIMLDNKDECHSERFHIFGTGHRIGRDDVAYIDTFYQGCFVWHLFHQHPF